jgi:hypothetical protein
MAHRGRRQADDALLLALACGATVEHAARQAGVAARTAHRRLSDESFRRRLQALRADMVQRSSGALTAAWHEAVRTLLELLRPTMPPAVRLGAARSVLEIGMKVRENAELEERLAALDARLSGPGGS